MRLGWRVTRGKSPSQFRCSKCLAPAFLKRAAQQTIFRDCRSSGCNSLRYFSPKLLGTLQVSNSFPHVAVHSLVE